MNSLLVAISAWFALLLSAWLMVGRLLAPVARRSRGRRPTACLLVLGFLAPLTALAQAPERISLDEAISRFAMNNPGLRIARLRSTELAALARQAREYPNPTLDISHEPSRRAGESGSETYLTLSQRILSPGLRQARGVAADRIVAISREEFAADSLQLVFDLKREYARALGAEASIKTLAVVADLFRWADRAAEAMKTEGEASGYSLRRLRVERARHEGGLALAEVEVDEARRRLTLLLAPATTSALYAPLERQGVGDLRVDLGSALDLARANRPELRRARAGIASASAELSVARRERTPDPIVTGGYVRQTGGLAGVFLGLSSELPVFDQNQGLLAARSAGLSAAETLLFATERQVDADVRRSFAAYESARRRRALISGELLIEADRMLESARVSYAEGEMMLIELLDAAEAYLDAKLTDIELSTDFQIISYDLQRAMGGTNPE
ncbi:MAG: cobalt-zinc-cadmium efflux system outer membrane protein [Rhodothermales bacterium]|jgi:cobalt-zinc-cadmium efflux system outer membrane protein